MSGTCIYIGEVLHVHLYMYIVYTVCSTFSFHLDSNGRVFTPFLRINYEEWEPDLESSDTIRVMYYITTIHHSVTIILYNHLP